MRKIFCPQKNAILQFITSFFGGDMSADELKQVIQGPAAVVFWYFLAIFVNEECWEPIDVLFIAQVTIFLECAINLRDFHVGIADEFLS